MWVKHVEHLYLTMMKLTTDKTELGVDASV